MRLTASSILEVMIASVLLIIIIVMASMMWSSIMSSDSYARNQSRLRFITEEAEFRFEVPNISDSINTSINLKVNVDSSTVGVYRVTLESDSTTSLASEFVLSREN